jgi:hypothetical protein
VKYQLELTRTELLLLRVLLEEDLTKRFNGWVDEEGYPLTEEFFDDLDQKLYEARRS